MRKISLRPKKNYQNNPGVIMMDFNDKELGWVLALGSVCVVLCVLLGLVMLAQQLFPGVFG